MSWRDETNFEEGLKKLIGTKINEILTDDDKHFLVFKTDSCFHIFYVGGDCCSHGWMESINNLEALKEHVIQEIEAIKDSDIPGLSQDDFEYGQIYSLKIKTDAGDVDIEFRHTHNGYYSIILQYLGQFKSIEELKTSPELEDYTWDYHVNGDLEDAEFKVYKNKESNGI